MNVDRVPDGHRAGDAERVTRDVEPWAVRDLLDDSPRATLAFVHGDAVELVPVRARSLDGTYLVGVLPDAVPDLEQHEVLLVLDDGAYWFELRGISVRGVAARVDSPEAGPMDRLRWYAIAPRRVLAWDYGAIREE